MEALAARRTRAFTVAAIAAAGLSSLGLLVGQASASPPTWVPTAAEQQKALAVARVEAATTIPGSNGAPQTLTERTWPSNVKHVSIVGSSRQDASQFVDGSPSDDRRRVVIIRMLGDFSVANTGPAGASPFSTGHQMTLVVDAATGDVLDFGLEPEVTPEPAGAIQQYSR